MSCCFFIVVLPWESQIEVEVSKVARVFIGVGRAERITVPLPERLALSIRDQPRRIQMIAINVTELLLLLRRTSRVPRRHRKVQSRAIRNRPREGQRHRAVERESRRQALPLKRRRIKAVEVIPRSLNGFVQAPAVDAVHVEIHFRRPDIGVGFDPHLNGVAGAQLLARAAGVGLRQ